MNTSWKALLMAGVAMVTIVGCEEPQVAKNEPPINLRDATAAGPKGAGGVGAAAVGETEFGKKHAKDWVGSKLSDKQKK